MNNIKEGDIVKIVTDSWWDCEIGSTGRVVKCFKGLQNYYHILVNGNIHECTDKEIEKVGGLLV